MQNETTVTIPRKRKGEVFKFTVEGKGIFPFDMLRYDNCYPADDEVVTDLLPSRNDFRALVTRRVTLKSLFPPTDGRWRSFGWKVVDIR